ncbi:unnamed protein product [Blepharisma stoltei]|uniref:Tetratricopeptide repeat protein 29 n=1 Tax=Blepharisma stoltei TaxID=1481888 RepID=A0AAU9IKT0_9CILI|nr:unnamed protein product [Blepharisma stoltei]
MLRTQPDAPIYPKPLLGRKFAPISGAVEKRTTAGKTQFQDFEVSEIPATGKSIRPQQSSRSGTTSRRNLTGSVQDGHTQIIGKENRETACIKTLQIGYPQSYIDLFYLTHGKFQDLEIKEQVIKDLRERLIPAEQLNREGDYPGAFQGYHELGSYFERMEIYDAATYFYDRCVEIANKRELFYEAATAYQGLGNCAYKTKQIELAISMFERGVKISETHDLKHSVITLSRCLIEVYRLEADKLEEEGKTDLALGYHSKCLESAKNADDLVAQGNACYRMGLIYFQNTEYQTALEYFQRYLELSRNADYLEGVTNALAKIAAAYQEMSNISQAIKHLEQLNQEASENNKHSAEAEASLHLGLLYQKQGQHKKAVEFLDKHFSLARKLQDRTLIDTARVNLGIAQANCTIDNFIDVIGGNLSGLIQWKTKRSKF